MRAILAVSDLTPGSDGAVSTAARIAGRTASAFHVVHSMEIVGMPLWEAVQTDVGRRIHDAEAALEAQIRRAVPPGLAPESRALGFHAHHDVVLLRAREVGADLVVFAAADPRTQAGARHLGALRRVAEAAELPCLLVREPLHHPPGRVLLPLSAAEVGQGVLADACDWLASLEGLTPAGRPRTELQVLHVASGAREWRELAAELDREVRWAGEQRQWSERLRIRRIVRWSPAAHMEILRAATEQVPDLVLLGPGCGVANSAAYLNDARALLLRRLPCSVLVLPGTLRAGEEERSPTPLPEAEASERDAPEPDEALEIAAAGD